MKSPQRIRRKTLNVLLLGGLTAMSTGCDVEQQFSTLGYMAMMTLGGWLMTAWNEGLSEIYYFFNPPIGL